MKRFLEKLSKLDRRIIFVLVVIVVMFPIIKPLNLQRLSPTPAVKGIYDMVESIPEGQPVIISFDFDPGSKPELYPMAMAFCRHAFKRNLRVIGMNLWVPGTGLADEILTRTANESEKLYGKKKVYGKDYVFMGWQPQPSAVITQMGTDIYGIYAKDQRGNDLRSMEVMKGIKSLKDMAFMMEFGAGTPGIEEWIAYGSDKFGFKIGTGSTAVNETTLRPYLQTGQLVGLIGAMKGAAEYEALINHPDTATAGMDAIGMGHMLILGLILLGNGIVIALKFL